MGRIRLPALAIAFLLPVIAACGTAPTAPVETPAATEADMSLGAALALSCSGCHSPAGGAITNLEGRTADNIRQALLVYYQDPDGTTVMHRMIRGYSEADIEAISAYLGEEATE
ncbi:putative sulfide dehydrogenase, cytochrome subunit [Hyphomonas neptunium ATCC 15444]|uniref:Putative sulfide dehydrogenase, cytochrome subunit n=2 Tax=Hyphomonas TaxID=85 RepID=Q0BZB7_HYPNA|nr:MULTISPECIES: cytochrome c [Hyphomonas]ABI76707.1 putative sulfide dehydrogenase, cytochrome subunit [Hyphomonas neptunium ATCC 15444]KCZ95265.1 putative sulfide dehydrogenase, cytochrome subunit [Hyphomonas hirschiana VP5]